VRRPVPTRPLSLVNRRLHALCAFGASVSTIEVVAPRSGERTLAQYFLRGESLSSTFIPPRDQLQKVAGVQR